MHSSSRYSNNQHSLPPRISASGPYSCSGGDFQMMDITVSVLGLTGIMMQTKKGKDGTREASMSVSDSLSSESTSTQNSDDLNTHVAALASFYKNVTNSETSIASHMPSLALRAPSSDIANEKYRYTATWPTDFDPSGNELSTFKCARLMRKERLSREYIQREDGASSVMAFVPEKVQLNIGLRRGSEIITLGSAMILITGEETDDIHVSLPINTTKVEHQEEFGGKLKKARSKMFGKSSTKKKKRKPISFTKAPRRKYNLDDNASLNVLIRVTPSHYQEKCHASTRDNSYPTLDYNSVPDVLHISNSHENENDGCLEKLPSNDHLVKSRSRSMNRCTNYPEEDYQSIDRGNARSHDIITPIKRETSRTIRLANRGRTHSEPGHQYNGERILRACENTVPLKESTNLRDADEVIPHGLIDSNSTKYSTKQANDQIVNYNYESRFDVEDNALEEPAGELSYYVPSSRGKTYPEYDSKEYTTHSEHKPYADEIETRPVDKSETSLKQGLKANNRIIQDKPSPAENKKASFFGSNSIFHCGDMMNVLNENERKVYTKEIPCDENSLQYEEEEPIPDDSFDSDGDTSTIGMCYGNVGKSNVAVNNPRGDYIPHDSDNVENESFYETYCDEESRMPDEYTCATEPTHNKYEGSRIMREDKARNMIDNYANRMGVHPTKMV